MADIKQAAKWLKEGKRVRRPDFGQGYSQGIDSCGYLRPYNPQGKIVNNKRSLDPDDLLADDWEIAE